MTGLIICGYPGIGKTACAGWNGCIDLESSVFSTGAHPFDTNSIEIQGEDSVASLTVPSWVYSYCNVAIYLATQGFTVFVSTHKDVRRALQHMTKIPVVIFCPKVEWKEQWIERLQKRYEQTKLIKDQRALKHVMEFWDKSLPEMVDEAHAAKWPVVQPAAIDYDLKDYIYFIQRNYGAMDQHGASVSPLHFLHHAIEVSDGEGAYFVGLRNGMRFAASLIDGKDPQFEHLIKKKGESNGPVQTEPNVHQHSDAPTERMETHQTCESKDESATKETS